MIRPFTCLCLLAAAGSGLYLYTAKHDAQMLDREITKLSHQAQDSRARAALMRAEYDRLGDPDRLRELANQVLTLQPTDPKQFSSMADLERRLPPVSKPEDAPPQVVATASEPLPIFKAPPSVERPVAERPIVEKPMIERPAPEKLLAERSTAEKPVPERPAPERLAAEKPTQPTPRPTPTPRPPAMAPSLLASAQAAQRASRQMATAEPRPTVVAQVVSNLPMPSLSAMPRPTPLAAPVRRAQPISDIAPSTTAEVVARAARGGSLDTSSPVVASALGMARSMMQAPSPVSTANAASYRSYTPTAYAPGQTRQ